MSDQSKIPVVFISSTAEDLKLFRAAARDAAIEAECLPRMMEYFAASGENPPLEACLKKVSEADVVVVIVAHRYGWVPADQSAGGHKSITWLECGHAADEGKEVLAFLVDEKAPWPEEQREEHRMTAALREGREDPELLAAVAGDLRSLKALKTWLNSRGIRATFTTPEDLRGKVHFALQHWKLRHGAFPPAPTARERAPADPGKYLRTLLKRTGFIDIRRLQVGTGKAHRFPIEDLYISLTTTIARSGLPKDAQRKTARRSERPASRDAMADESAKVPLHEALSNSRLVVVGDPGSGKTTVLNRVAHALCQAWLDVDAEAAKRVGIQDRPFPILMRAAELWAHLAEQGAHAGRPPLREVAAALPQSLAAASQGDEWGLDENFFGQQLREGPCLLLLDGLDEAPDRLARESLSRLIENVSTAYEACRVIVTSRPPAYTGEAVLPGFTHAQVDPLDQDAIRTFLDRWSRALWGDAAEAEAHRDELQAALSSRPEIARMARNPVMLTALAVVHWNERRLPEQRADLYESIIKWLARSREQRQGRPPADLCVLILQELALSMQDHPDGRIVQVTRHWAAVSISARFGGKGQPAAISLAESFLEQEELDSGIIVGRGNELQFWHLTFQEFLAARAIAAQEEAKQQSILLGPTRKMYLPEWREVVLLLGGVLHQQGPPKVDGLIRAVLDDLGKDATLAGQARCAGVLGAVLKDLAPLQYRTQDPRYPQLLETVLGIFEVESSKTIPVDVRIEAADALGQAGDPRLDPANPQRWVKIPAGPFKMGAQKKNRGEPNYDPHARDYEAPVHEVYLESYRIGRYPVTVYEYRWFVEAGGYADRRWWGGGGFEKWQSPGGWEDQLRFPNRPVVNVSWFEAAAYCGWAGCRLPSEAEWERAARGTEGRRFPWGNEPQPDPSRLNYDRKVGHSTPVGVFPLGGTPDGIQDMAGNAWEWCQDWHDAEYYAKSPKSNPSGPEKGDRRVVRGGSWDFPTENARAAIRLRAHPGYRFGYFGFRVVVAGGARTR